LIFVVTERIRLKRQQMPPFLACRSAMAGMKLHANARPVAYEVDRSRRFRNFLYAHAAFGIG
jgi:hypothetical protein